MTKRNQKAQETKDAYDKALASKDKALEDANKAHQKALTKLEKDYQDKLAQKEADAQKAREACQKAHAEKDAKIDSLTKELANKDDAAKKAEEAYKKQLADKDAELAKEKSRIVATQHKMRSKVFLTEIGKTEHKKDNTKLVDLGIYEKPIIGNGTRTHPELAYITYKNTTIENGIQTHHYAYNEPFVPAPTDHL